MRACKPSEYAERVVAPVTEAGVNLGRYSHPTCVKGKMASFVSQGSVAESLDQYIAAFEQGNGPLSVSMLGEQSLHADMSALEQARALTRGGGPRNELLQRTVLARRHAATEASGLHTDSHHLSTSEPSPTNTKRNDGAQLGMSGYVLVAPVAIPALTTPADRDGACYVACGSASAVISPLPPTPAALRSRLNRSNKSTPPSETPLSKVSRLMSRSRRKGSADLLAAAVDSPSSAEGSPRSMSTTTPVDTHVTQRKKRTAQVRRMRRAIARDCAAAGDSDVPSPVPAKLATATTRSQRAKQALRKVHRGPQKGKAKALSGTKSMVAARRSRSSSTSKRTRRPASARGRGRTRRVRRTSSQQHVRRQTRNTQPLARAVSFSAASPEAPRTPATSGRSLVSPATGSSAASSAVTLTPSTPSGESGSDATVAAITRQQREAHERRMQGVRALADLMEEASSDEEHATLSRSNGEVGEPQSMLLEEIAQLLAEPDEEPENLSSTQPVSSVATSMAEFAAPRIGGRDAVRLAASRTRADVLPPAASSSPLRGSHSVSPHGGPSAGSGRGHSSSDDWAAAHLALQPNTAEASAARKPTKSHQRDGHANSGAGGVPPPEGDTSHWQQWNQVSVIPSDPVSPVPRGAAGRVSQPSPSTPSRFAGIPASAAATTVPMGSQAIGTSNRDHQTSATDKAELFNEFKEWFQAQQATAPVPTVPSHGVSGTSVTSEPSWLVHHRGNRVGRRQHSADVAVAPQQESHSNAGTEQLGRSKTVHKMSRDVEAAAAAASPRSASRSKSPRRSKTVHKLTATKHRVVEAAAVASPARSASRSKSPRRSKTVHKLTTTKRSVSPRRRDDDASGSRSKSPRRSKTVHKLTATKHRDVEAAAVESPARSASRSKSPRRSKTVHKLTATKRSVSPRRRDDDASGSRSKSPRRSKTVHKLTTTKHRDVEAAAVVRSARTQKSARRQSTKLRQRNRSSTAVHTPTGTTSFQGGEGLDTVNASLTAAAVAEAAVAGADDGSQAGGSDSDLRARAREVYSSFLSEPAAETPEAQASRGEDALSTGKRVTPLDGERSYSDSDSDSDSYTDAVEVGSSALDTDASQLLHDSIEDAAGADGAHSEEKIHSARSDGPGNANQPDGCVSIEAGTSPAQPTVVQQPVGTVDVIARASSTLQQTAAAPAASAMLLGDTVDVETGGDAQIATAIEEPVGGCTAAAACMDVGVQTSPGQSPHAASRDSNGVLPATGAGGAAAEGLRPSAMACSEFSDQGVQSNIPTTDAACSPPPPVEVSTVCTGTSPELAAQRACPDTKDAAADTDELQASTTVDCGTSPQSASRLVDVGTSPQSIHVTQRVDRGSSPMSTAQRPASVRSESGAPSGEASASPESGGGLVSYVSDDSEPELDAMGPGQEAVMDTTDVKSHRQSAIPSARASLPPQELDRLVVHQYSLPTTAMNEAKGVEADGDTSPRSRTSTCSAPLFVSRAVQRVEPSFRRPAKPPVARAVHDAFPHVGGSPCRQPSSAILLARRRVNLVACRAGRDSTRRGACVPPPPLPVPELDGAGHPATAPSLLPGQRAPGRRSRRVPGATRSLSPRQRWVAVGEAKAAPAPEARMRSEMHEQTPAPVRRRVPSTPHAAPSLEDPQVGFVAVSAALVCCLPAMSVRAYCHVRLYVLVASGGGSIRSCAVSRVTVA